eukprot:TRINITY_DN6850_c0_g1_i1.p1 TRINITY_DN6850_c0_g1~~TRINITY_DN6850_c0_g1_i1.p1  ORF type:complete len:514 (-),score=87.70 TRINITY_DN6850_c0_g1_i1:120-1661(-)
MYALIGTFFNTVLMGLSIWSVSDSFREDWSLTEALLYGSLISAVDPVAVLAIFESVHVNQTLDILVFGESVLNDAVSIVLYNIFKSMLKIDTITVALPFTAVAKFFYVSIGGVVVGLVFATVASFVTRFTSPVMIIEPLIIGCFALLAYLVAETFGMSGIVSILFCGIMMSRYAKFNMQRKSSHTLKFLLKMAATTSETAVFIYLGVSTIFHPFVDDIGSKWDAGLILFTLFLIMPFRFVITYGLTFIANRRRLIAVSWLDQFIIAYGGLRGAIAFALAFEIPKDVSTRDVTITATLVVVWFTVFVIGSTIKPWLKLLDIKLMRESNELDKVLPEAVPYVMKIIGYIHGGQRGFWSHKHYWHFLDKKLTWLLVRKSARKNKHLPEAEMNELTLATGFSESKWQKMGMSETQHNLMELVRPSASDRSSNEWSSYDENTVTSDSEENRSSIYSESDERSASVSTTSLEEQSDSLETALTPKPKKKKKKGKKIKAKGKKKKKQKKDKQKKGSEKDD